MKEDRFDRLRQAYPDASYSVLHYLPDGFEKDAAKAEAFFKTWAAAEDLASMLESRVKKFAKHFSDCFPGALPPGFEDLAEKHSSLFLEQVKRAAAQDGAISSEFLYSAFGSELEKIQALEKQVRAAHEARMVPISLDRRGRGR
jgi:hypothetical protein